MFFNVSVEETDLTIGARRTLVEQALDRVKKYRMQLKDYIKLQPEFLTSLKPVQAFIGAPEIAVRMCEAGKKSNVGPMAAVAGAFSELIGTELLRYTDEIIIENGGDIFIKSKVVRKIGIYAGSSPLSQKIGFEITPECTPMGICTSSGTVGHSLSFGRADAAIILSRDTFLADAVATATGNIVKDPGDIEKGIAFASSIQGVEGVVIIIGEKIGAWGDIQLIKL